MLKLTSQQFGRAVESLTQSSTKPSTAGAEKRVASRIEIDCQMMLATFPDNKVGRCYQALAKDISATGIGLMQGRPFARQEFFLLTIPIGKSEELVLVCQATFCRALTEGVHWCGAQFEAIATPEVIAALKETIKAKKIESAILG